MRKNYYKSGINLHSYPIDSFDNDAKSQKSDRKSINRQFYNKKNMQYL